MHHSGFTTLSIIIRIKMSREDLVSRHHWSVLAFAQVAARLLMTGERTRRDVAYRAPFVVKADDFGKMSAANFFGCEVGEWGAMAPVGPAEDR
jgi:hypothetical protein